MKKEWKPVLEYEADLVRHWRQRQQEPHPVELFIEPAAEADLPAPIKGLWKEVPEADKNALRDKFLSERFNKYGVNGPSWLEYIERNGYRR